MKLVKQILLSISMTVVLYAGAQDVHFSQFSMSPLLLNPALSGMGQGDYRVYGNFRTQWNTVAGNGAYRTFAGGGDMALGKVTRFSSFAGLGISFISDQAGTAGFQSNRLDLTFAYHFILNRRRNTSLSFGIQGAFNHRGFDPSKATYDSSWDPTTGQVGTGGVPEHYTRTKVFFGDVGAGMFFSTTVKDRTDIYFGTSFSHLNQPSISFFSSGSNINQPADKLYMKFTAHGGVTTQVGKRVWLIPNFFIMVQGPARQFNIGSLVKLQLSHKVLDRNFLYLGIQGRIGKSLESPMGDAVIAHVRFDYRNFTVGLSYDINVSKLQSASSTFGAPEISLMYTIVKKLKPRPGICPAML